ncbi:hypothetical protein [Clostridioides difficile]|uniref:hypothetical protein n=1 Tax=Clostridioides difficile TaxID=1496 RepID=UPI003A932A33
MGGSKLNNFANFILTMWYVKGAMFKASSILKYYFILTKWYVNSPDTTRQSLEKYVLY